MKEKEFNLLTEPWILALDLDGKMRLLSLLDCFEQAHGLYDLAGEMPAQNVMLLRLMLGIMYAVFGRQNMAGEPGLPEGPDDARQRWKELWDTGRFPMALLREYLFSDEIFDRFYLFHPIHPFLQVMVLPGSTVEVDGKALPINPLERPVKSLIGDLSESENTPNWFSHRNDKDSLDYPEAARWLIHLNAYDVSPLGAPPQGSFRAKGFKLPWTNTLGLVWAQGDNLFESLMLNFVLSLQGQDPWEEFVPSWERDTPFVPAELSKTEAVFPKEPCALFTFPFRYLQLLRDNGRVTGCRIWGGTLVNAENGNPLTETMTLWRFSKENRHVPKAHDPGKQVWRDFASLVSGAQAVRPGLVSWLSALQTNGALKKRALRLNTGGMVPSGKSTSIADSFSDSLRFNASILENLEDGWARAISAELALTERLVSQVAFLARDLVKASGGSGEKDPKAAMAKEREAVYFRLDTPFREWLAGLSESQEISAACQVWRDIEKRILFEYGEEMVRRAGLKALVGRIIKDKPGDSKGKLYAAPELFRWFAWNINKIIKE